MATATAETATTVMLDTAMITVHRDAGIVEIITPACSLSSPSESDWRAICKLLKRLGGTITEEPLYHAQTDTDVWTATF